MTSPSPLLACEKHSLLENSMDYSSSMESVAAPSLKQEDAHFGAERALARAERSKTMTGNKPCREINPAWKKTWLRKKVASKKKGGRQ